MPKKKLEEVAEEVSLVEATIAPIATLDTPFGNGELEVIRAKINEIIRR